MPFGKEHVLHTDCPFCGHHADRGTGLDVAAPRPGDLSVCLICCQVGMFTEAMNLRAPTPEEQSKIDRHFGTQVVRAACIAAAKERKANAS